MSSLFANFAMYVSYKEYFSAVEGPSEKFHSGERAGIGEPIAANG